MTVSHKIQITPLVVKKKVLKNLWLFHRELERKALLCA